jgi:hypothetical protein
VSVTEPCIGAWGCGTVRGARAWAVECGATPLGSACECDWGVCVCVGLWGCGAVVGSRSAGRVCPRVRDACACPRRCRALQLPRPRQARLAETAAGPGPAVFPPRQHVLPSLAPYFACARPQGLLPHAAAGRVLVVALQIPISFSRPCHSQTHPSVTPVLLSFYPSPFLFPFSPASDTMLGGTHEVTRYLVEKGALTGMMAAFNAAHRLLTVAAAAAAAAAPSTAAAALSAAAAPAEGAAATSEGVVAGASTGAGAGAATLHSDAAGAAPDAAAHSNGTVRSAAGGATGEVPHARVVAAVEDVAAERS